MKYTFTFTTDDRKEFEDVCNRLNPPAPSAIPSSSDFAAALERTREEPKKKKKTAKKAAKKKRPTAAEKRAAAAAEEAQLLGVNPPAIEDVETAVKTFIQENSVSAAKDIFSEFGASKMSEIPASAYSDLIDRLEE